MNQHIRFYNMTCSDLTIVAPRSFQVSGPEIQRRKWRADQRLLVQDWAGPQVLQRDDGSGHRLADRVVLDAAWCCCLPVAIQGYILPIKADYVEEHLPMKRPYKRRATFNNEKPFCRNCWLWKLWYMIESFNIPNSSLYFSMLVCLVQNHI